MTKDIFDSQTVHMMTDEEIVKELSKRIKRLRTGCGFSQEEFARRAGLSRETIKRIETGRAADISLTSLLKILRAGYMMDGIPSLIEDIPDPILRTRKGEEKKRFGYNKTDGNQ